jgi:hypothetical protein
VGLDADGRIWARVCVRACAAGCSLCGSAVDARPGLAWLSCVLGAHRVFVAGLGSCVVGWGGLGVGGAPFPCAQVIVQASKKSKGRATKKDSRCEFPALVPVVGAWVAPSPPPPLDPAGAGRRARVTSYDLQGFGACVGQGRQCCAGGVLAAGLFGRALHSPFVCEFEFSTRGTPARPTLLSMHA